jgi:hypothetical protein
VYYKDLSKDKRKLGVKRIGTIPISVVLLIGITYILRGIINIDYTEVNRIEITDGNTGKDIEIIDKDNIKHIIESLNSVAFRKYKYSLFRMGYTFNTKIYDNNGKFRKNIVINSDEDIRYNSYSYRAITNRIDYEFILDLYKQQYEGYHQ